ncbi:MAG TPA: hypothetical protein VK558_07780 [Patescibacteria group bacterium]|nr:hypothetical protein [Patescibacteria group bacterium]
MTVALIGLTALVIGGTLRHLQGGLDAQFGLHRWQVVVGYGLLSMPAAYSFWGLPLFGVPQLALLKACAMAALFVADMLLSQDFSKPWKVLWRFGAAPVLVDLLTGWWSAVLVGGILAVGTWALKKWGPFIPLWHPIFDGWEAWWEVMIGGVTGAAWALAPLLGG